MPPRKQKENNPRELPQRKKPENEPIQDPSPDSVPREDDPSEHQDDY